MVVGAAVPLRGPDGKVLGAFFGGNLLNGRYAIVDAIRDEVFPGPVQSRSSRAMLASRPTCSGQTVRGRWAPA